MVLMRSTAAALAALALLAACESDPKPKFEGDPTPSASATSQAIETSAPPSSSTAPASDPESVVRDWVDARNAALETGDTAPAYALSSDDCKSCDELLKVIDQVYDAGGSFDTTGWSIRSLKAKPASDPVEVDVAVVVAGGTTVASTGADPVNYAEEKRILTFRLAGDTSDLRVETVLFR